MFKVKGLRFRVHGLSNTEFGLTAFASSSASGWNAVLKFTETAVHMCEFMLSEAEVRATARQAELYGSVWSFKGSPERKRDF